MKYEIRSVQALTRKAKLRLFTRWLCYALVLLFLYAFMRTGIFGGIQPPLIIPLAIAVAMREREFGGSIFGAICGLLLDIAGNGLLGFTSVWLMPACLGAALLVTNLIKVNFLNHLWLSAGTSVLLMLMNFLFSYGIWNMEHTETVLVNYYLPTYLAAIVLSPALYFLVKLISSKLSEKETRELNEVAEEAAVEEKN